MRAPGRGAFWTLFVLAIAAFASAMLFRWLDRGGTFDVDTIRVRGIRLADSAAVAAELVPLLGRSLWSVPPDSMEERLRSAPWVETAEVQRRPPGTLVVSIGLERAGFMLATPGDTVPVSLEGHPMPGSFRSDTLPLVGAECMPEEALRRTLSGWLDSWDPEPEGVSLRLGFQGVVAELANGVEVLLGESCLERRWRSFRAVGHVVAAREEYGVVDMRFGGQAVLRPADSARGEVSGS